VVNLRAYENDILSALTATGGLPGLDVYDEIILFKGTPNNAAVGPSLETILPGDNPLEVANASPRVIRIPTRILAGQPLPFRPADILLQDGDVVFLEARASELFYTGGLLPAGQYELPRDYDLDVVEAVANVKGSMLNGAFGGNNLSGLLIQTRMGNPSPSLLTVLRRTPGGGHVPIRVDLNRAMRDPRERIRVQAGDVLILQETPGEALARYFTQSFNFFSITKAFRAGSASGDIITAGPNEIFNGGFQNF